VRKEDKLRVIDGNRRVLNNVLFGQKTISATIGEPIGDPMIYEAWIPTSTLVDFVSFHRHFFEKNHDITQHISKVIARLIKDSHAGQHEFRTNTLSLHVEEDKHLLEAVEKELIQMKENLKL
jgi:hypothetical protein